MRAAVYYGPGDIRVEEVDKPRVTPDGVLLRVRACGVCNVMDVDAWIRWPTGGLGVGKVRGHEWAGEIVEVGSRVKDFKVGDRIFQNPVFRPCYRCEYCRVGDYWRCINWREGLAQYGIHGGFAEYLLIPFVTKESAAKMPDDLSFRDLALVEPVYLGIGLARKVKPGESVLVLGQEVMGLAVVATLKKQGAGKIITADVSERRRKASEEFAPDLVIDPIEEDVVRTVMKATRGQGVDVVIVIDSRPATLLEAIGSVKRAGVIWLAAYYYSPFRVSSDIKKDPVYTRWIGPEASYTEAPVSFDPALLTMQCAWSTLGPRVPRWLEAAEMIRSGVICAEKHVTHIFSLEEIKIAFDTAAYSEDAIKVLVEI
ncbi:MAG: alcohol dehydrogenase catalytic domain-containing protein [candidate division WOR-3 bacterium]